MFMIVTYPWPVASAHVELTGPQSPEAGPDPREVTYYTGEQRGMHLEEMVEWTDLERMRFVWYRLRLAVRDKSRAARKAFARHPTRP